MEKFSTEIMGYSKKEINCFINEVENELSHNLTRMKALEKEVLLLRQELIKQKGIEVNLSNSLAKSEDTAKEIRQIARKEADLILNEARNNANRIVNDALLRAEKVELQKDTLERNMRIYKKKLRSIVEQQMSIVEEIEVLEL